MFKKSLSYIGFFMITCVILYAFIFLFNIIAIPFLSLLFGSVMNFFAFYFSFINLLASIGSFLSYLKSILFRKEERGLIYKSIHGLIVFLLFSGSGVGAFYLLSGNFMRKDSYIIGVGVLSESSKELLFSILFFGGIILAFYHSFGLIFKILRLIK